MPRSPHHVEIADRQKVLEIDPGRLIRLARSVLVAEGVIESEISVALVDNPQMHAINRDFLKHDYPTDVISFLLDEEVVEPSKRTRRTAKSKISLPRGIGKSLSGEVIISTEYAVRLATEYGWPPEHEVLLYLVHGLLHVCGYDDLSDKELRIMRVREVELLAPWKLVPRYESNADQSHAKKSKIAK